MHDAPPDRRAHLALVAFGYWHYGLVLGVVALAAGLKKAISHPFDPLEGWIALELALGTALFVFCDVGFRKALALSRSHVRLAAAVAAAATIPIGTEVAAAAQVVALAAIVTLALAVETYATRVTSQRDEGADAFG